MRLGKIPLVVCLLLPGSAPALDAGRRPGSPPDVGQTPSPTLKGPNSSDPTDGTRANPFNLTTPRTLSSLFGDLPITPQHFPELYSGDDATVAVQTAIDTALAQNRPFSCHGDYRVSQIVVASGGLRFTGNCRFLGNATAPTPSVLEFRAGVVNITGKLEVSAQYRTNYEAAFWWNTNAQGSEVHNLSATQAKLCYKIGSPDKPSTLLSELTFFGGHTYGCTQVAQFIGTETYVHVVGAQWGSDDLGAPSRNWAGIRHKGIVAVGADVTVTGGELLMAGITTGVLVENQPIAAPDKGVQWGRVRIRGTTVESASQLANTLNPEKLASAPAAGNRGLISFTGVGGYHSQDLTPLLQTGADYDGEVVWQNSRMWFPAGQRKRANVLAGSTKTDVWVDDLGFGTGFRAALSGTENGIAHHGFRQVLYAFGVTQPLTIGGQSIAFQTVDPSGDVARYLRDYTTGTGIFTVPPGGLAEVEVSVNFDFPGAQGAISVLQAGGRIAKAPIVDGVGQVRVTRRNMPAGATLQAFAELTALPTGGQGAPHTNHIAIAVRN
ncbi:hypothetical protein [Methylobacterium sp. J-068]|uniref:hypothetical protein n=1 Tax=Methylobacterium sp. J-068 TaxID=2836649 RepID=UPI001FBC0086|nr:hypothetical protein [Methylobacterium sp. J-068]MCJ2035416.1 hypothetical protein [Methylobacterium sp. J-068]